MAGRLLTVHVAKQLEEIPVQPVEQVLRHVPLPDIRSHSASFEWVQRRLAALKEHGFVRSFDTQAMFDQAPRSIAVILCGRTTKDVMHLAKSIEKVEPDGTALDSRSQGYSITSSLTKS